MGAELIVPALISALGAGAGAYTQHRAASTQDAVAAENIRQQQMRQREADQRVNQELGTMERSDSSDEQRAAENDYLRQLRATRSNAEGDADVPMGGSRFQEDTEASKAGIGNFGRQVANTLSRIDAPTRQRFGEAISSGRTASDLTGIQRNASGDDYLRRLRIQSTRANPWITAGGQVLQGIGSGMAASGWGTGGQALQDQMAQMGRDTGIIKNVGGAAFGR